MSKTQAKLSEILRQASFGLFSLGALLWTAGIIYLILLYWQYFLGLMLLSSTSVWLFFQSFGYEKDDSEK